MLIQQWIKHLLYLINMTINTIQTLPYKEQVEVTP